MHASASCGQRSSPAIIAPTMRAVVHRVLILARGVIETRDGGIVREVARGCACSCGSISRASRTGQ